MASNDKPADWAKAIGGEPELGCMHDVLTEAATTNADSIALVCPHYPSDLYTFSNQPNATKSQPYLRWTYRHLQQVSHAIAAGLYEKGICPGMTIAIFPIVGAEFQIIARAAWELRCTLASIDPASISNPKEIQHMLNCSNPSVILVPTTELAEKLDKNAEETLQENVLKFVTNHKQISCQNGWSHFQEFFNFGQKHQDLDFSSIEHHLDDEILVIFTSGTTSLPKGCVHTNTSMSASCLAKKNLGQADNWPVVSAHSPLFHAIGIMVTFYAPACTIVHPSESFAPGALLNAIQNEKVTHMCLVPAMLNLLAEHQNLPTTDTSSLEMIHMGGGNVLSQHNQDCIKILKSKKAHTIYGMSECWTPTCYHIDRIPDLKRSDVGCGVVVPGAMLKVCAPESTTVLKRDEAGELHMGGPQILKRYIGAKSQPIYEDEDGRWFATGDQAIMNQDGEIFIVGRYKELIIRGGHNIAPTAIEKVFSAYGGVQSAVVGIEDETAGEVPIAVVRGQGLTQEDLDNLRRTTIDKLGSAYAPEMILTLKDLDLDDFPKTTSGKLRKQTLQPLVQEYVNAQQKSANDTDKNLEQKLCSLWSRALNHKNITPQDRITDMADSLVLSRGRTFLRRDLGINITGEEILEHDTVEKQAKLLASRTGTTDEGQDYKDLQTTREGPPQLNDMIHTYGSEARETMTRDKCESLLQPLGLSWADVEDVYPMPDLMKIWAQPLRKQSVNHRHAFVVNTGETQHVQKALEKVLAVHSTLRSLSVDIDRETTCYAVLRATSKFFANCILQFDKPVKTANDLQSFILDDQKYDFAGPPGLLNRFYLVPIEDTKKTGLLFLGQHCCFDVLSSLPFYEDLDKALSSETETVAGRVPFKAWAEHYFSGRTSLSAKLGVDYHVNRLTGISGSANALFPPQRAAEWFKGHHFGWVPDPSVHTDQSMIDARLEQQTHIGVEGKATVVHASDLSNLKKTHGIDAAIVLKAALSLVNTGETGATEALFASYQAGRSWPFIAPWMQERLPSAMDIAGPTLQVAIERIGISKSQSVIDFLKHLTAEQEELTKHVHAPLLSIRGGLSTADAETMEQVRRRQIFNWLPRSSGLDEYTNLKRVQLWSRTDVGVLWNCTAIGDDEVKIHVSWDDAQLNEDEIDKLLGKFGEMVEMLSARSNWDEDVNVLLKRSIGTNSA